MPKINPADYKQDSDILSPDDIEDAAVLTVSEFMEGEREGKKGRWALLKFEETGNKVIWLTDVAMEALVERYGDDTDNWTGAKIPVEQYDTRKGPRVRIMALEEWDAAFKEAGVKVTTTARAAAPTARASTTSRAGSGRR